ncbi:hypothetical protein EG329_004505 [Mollisiaceae sp. DMI_Dod_QoI]|nr:hypothetical protein EG329_004505 [Helotiales sp. DMI_Dod_QoI]
MASTIRQAPGVDYFSKQKRPQNSIVTTYWDTPYTDPALVSSDSCDSTLPSPTSPLTVSFPQAYSIPKEDFNPTVKSEQAFDFGTCEDWMRWDDPSDAALSPTSDFFPEFKVEPVSPSMSGLELQGSGIGNINIEDSAVFGEDPITEEPLFQTPNALITPPITELPREGLYSTPLSWSRPSVGQSYRSDSDSYALSPQEESKLRDIAMPSQSSQQYPASPSSASSPEPCEQNSRKRKSSVEDDDEDDSPPPTSSRGHPVKKTAHNMIEKRYRTNLNDKIAALRDSVPSLRVMSKKNSRGEEVQEDLQGLTPAHKLNKATVLSKATEYIAHLEKRNKYLVKENANLKSRVDAFEILVMSRQSPNGAGMKQQQRNPSMGRQQQQQQHMQRPAYSCSRGLGLELATQLASSSNVSTIFATARKESPALKELIQKSNGRVVSIALETTSQESIKQAVTEVEKALGGKGLDVLINNAGIMDYTPEGASAMSAEDLNNVLTTNVTAVHLMMQAFLPLLAKGSLKKIVNITSTLGSIAMAKGFLQSPSPAYKISKAALNMLTVQYALQQGKAGFTIFGISPGWLKTDLGGVDYADLEVSVGAKAVLDKVFDAKKEDNGTFMNIRVEGWEDTKTANKYDGKSPPW